LNLEIVLYENFVYWMPVWLILVLPGVLLRNETTRYEAAEERNSNFEEEKRIGKDRGTDFQTR
jgi:hypothetical protein